jgi:hypothetical protein
MESKMTARPLRHVPLNREFELDRFVPLAQVSELSTLSRDTIKRNHREKIIRLSPRRLGMRLRDALMLSPNR